MTTTLLTSSLIKSAACPPNKKKTDFFDSECKGLMLEVRCSGGKTYSLRYQDERGKTRQVKLADAADITLTQARVLADKRRNQIAMGEDPLASKALLKLVPTVSAFIRDSYLPYVKTYKRSWITDESLLRNHVEPVWGKRYLDEINKQDVIKLITDHRATHAPGSCNRLLILLRYVFNLSIRWEMPGIKTNPTHGFPLMEENNKNERYLTQTEAETLYEALGTSDNQMLKFIVQMLIVTGVRKRELLDSRWEDFDLEHQSWRIPLSKSGKARHVPLSEGAVTILRSMPRTPKCDWAFANPKTGKPYVSFYYSWDTARKQAGLADVRVHDLRHSFASFLVNAGRSLYEVQKILGHTQIKTTQRYAHLSKDSLISAANAVPRFMVPLKLSIPKFVSPTVLPLMASACIMSAALPH